MMQKPKLCIICDQRLTSSRCAAGFQFCNSPACEVALRQHLHSNFPCCGACGRLLKGTVLRSAEVRVCGRPECQTYASQFRAPSTAVCQVCGIVLAPQFGHRLSTLCCSPFCQSWHTTNTRASRASEKSLQREQRRQALTDLALTESLSAQPAVHQLDPPKVAVLPYFEAKLISPSKERLRRVEALLLGMATEAQAIHFATVLSNERSQDPDQHAEPQSNLRQTETKSEKLDQILGAACGTCGGLCCRPGGDTGFLNVAKFSEMMLQQPRSSPHEMVLQYMHLVPSETVEDSCVFHGRTGCVLKRTQRTVTCNNYMCSSLQRLRDDAAEGQSHYLLAATNLRDEDEIHVYRINHCK